ncbi:MAG: response regulator transcription factor [Actinomycetota bacterium]
MSAVRVVVAEDDVLLRSGVVALLRTVDGIEVAGEAGSLSELLDLVDECRPDVVVTDVRMPPNQSDEGIEAARRIRASSPDTGVVVLSQHAEPEYVLSVFEAGNDRLGYLLKENVSSREALTSAVNTVADGGSVVDPSLVSVLVSARSTKRTGLDGLTPRERDVLALIAEGLNNAAIAQRLSLGDRAVSKHINSIFSKLGLGSEPDAHRRVRAVLMWLAAT